MTPPSRIHLHSQLRCITARGSRWEWGGREECTPLPSSPSAMRALDPLRPAIPRRGRHFTTASSLPAPHPPHHHTSTSSTAPVSHNSQLPLPHQFPAPAPSLRSLLCSSLRLPAPLPPPAPAVDGHCPAASASVTADFPHPSLPLSSRLSPAVRARITVSSRFFPFSSDAAVSDRRPPPRSPPPLLPHPQHHRPLLLLLLHRRRRLQRRCLR